MIVAVGSWRGLGATTTALALAATLAHESGEDAWLVEADPAGGVVAGRVHLAPYAVGGLERVAFPNDRTAVETLHEVAQRVGEVYVVAGPADPFRAHTCHHPRQPWAPALAELPGTVVIDVGRLRAGSPVWPLLRHVDELLLVTSAEVSAAVASDDWLASGGLVAPSETGLDGMACRLVVVESPGGVAFPRATLLADLGARSAGWLSWDAPAADLLWRGAGPGDRRLRRSPLVRDVQRLAAGLRERVVA